ncbi:MAG: carboxynorspermidine decarboxylase [Acholeplasmatales bacterium]|nr:carboxynorspermidine decarboxylase [Acholeplasmatales bacterium]
MRDLRDPFIRFKDKTPEEMFKGVKTPFFAMDEKRLIENGKIIKGIQDRTGCKILLALKCFSNYDLFQTLSPFIAGTEASGLFEARLGKEELPNKEVHVFSGAYRDDEFDEILQYADHIVFNSINQLRKFGPKAKLLGKKIGVRINPEYSTQKGPDIYDPCSKKSRLGITIDSFEKEMNDELFSLLSGIHFHTLCQQNSDDLEKTLYVVNDKFGKYLRKLKWVNFGGGHHIVRSDYDINRLENCIKYAKDNWNTEVYLEPGEGIVLNAGYLVSKVLDTFKNHDDYIAISDSSAACHMPDVIEMPYLPPLYMADLDDCNIEYRIGGPTCLSGDVTGDYKFSKELNVGDYLIFGDMALYTTVKTNTFNGMPLPDIYILHSDDTLEKLTNFGYMDFKYRLGKTK